MAQNATTDGGQTQKERVLRVVENADGSLTSNEVYDRLLGGPEGQSSDTLSGVRGTLSNLKAEGKVEATNDGNRLRYLRATDEEPADEDDDGSEESGTGLSALFENVEEGENGTESYQNGDEDDDSPEEVTASEESENVDYYPEDDEETVERTVVEEEGLQISLSGPVERVERVEDLLSATCDGGEVQASVGLPVADRSADLDHARVISKLGKSSLIRPYLRELLGIPGDRTASEQRAEDEEAVEVVEKK
jgi:hypothetical protein